MKKDLLHLMAVMIVVLLSVGFTSCSSDDDEGGSFSHPIVGTWDRDNRGGDTQITFKSNMTAVLTDRDGDVTMTATGDYKIDGNRFTIHWKKATAQNVTIDMDLTESSLFEINDDKMTTIADDGDVITWTRK